MKKHKMRPIGWLLIGIAILIIPTAIYAGFLIPKMKEEYIILMSSAGGIGGAGLFGANMIPDTLRYGSIYKNAARSAVLIVVITLVQDFMKELIGLVAVLAVSYVIFLIFKELWKNAKRVKENGELAEEIARGITQATE